MDGSIVWAHEHAADRKKGVEAAPSVVADLLLLTRRHPRYQGIRRNRRIRG